jgi:hypothetical protein
MARQLDYRGRYGAPGGEDPPPGRGVRGQQIGTLAAELSTAKPRIKVLQTTRDDVALPKAEFDRLVAQLQSVPVEGQPISLSLAGGLGRYRLTAEVRNGETVVVGLPLRDVDTFLIELIGLETILALLAVGGAVIAARAVVAGRSTGWPRPPSRSPSSSSTGGRWPWPSGYRPATPTPPPRWAGWGRRSTTC